MNKYKCHEDCNDPGCVDCLTIAYLLSEAIKYNILDDYEPEGL